MKWINADEKLPVGNDPFVATDGKDFFCIGYPNWLHKLGDLPGIYLPAKYGRGIRVTHWLKLPKVPKNNVTEQ